MNLNHIGTQVVQLFEIESAHQGFIRCRRWGTNHWEIQSATGLWEPASAVAELEAAYLESLGRVHAKGTRADAINLDRHPLSVEKRLCTLLNPEQQALVSKWIEQEAAHHSEKAPDSADHVDERVGYFSARLKALAQWAQPK